VRRKGLKKKVKVDNLKLNYERFYFFMSEKDKRKYIKVHSPTTFEDTPPNLYSWN